MSTNGARVLRTAFLGPEASFSHQAAVEALPFTNAEPLSSFKGILQALQNPESAAEKVYDYAVLPVENSTNGSVVQAFDLLAQCGLDPETSSYPDIEAVDEHYLEVHHCLFVSRAWAAQRLDEKELVSLPAYNGGPTSAQAKSGQPDGTNVFKGALGSEPASLALILKKLNIKMLYTHPQVWGQCNNILSTHLPPRHVERVDMSSTSAAAAYVAKSGLSENEGGESAGIAAISSSLAGSKHSKDLVCVATNIEDEPGANTTRFLVLQNRKRYLSQPGNLQPLQTNVQIKSLWAFTIAHHMPGSLAATLAVFARHHFNLSAIQSRPRPKAQSHNPGSSTIAKIRRQDSNWKYVFFVECLHTGDSAVHGSEDASIGHLLQELESVTERVNLLGSWEDKLAKR